MPEQLATVKGIYRYPVKSMLGEEIERSWGNDRGLVGDRAFAVVDSATKKIASAKNPRLWKDLLFCRACYERNPGAGSPLPAVEIHLPTGDVLSSDDNSTNQKLSQFFGRSVELLRQAPPLSSFEDYWPDIEGLSPEGHRDTYTDEPISRFAPSGTFFDMSAFHVVTTQTLEAARESAPASQISYARYRPNVVIDWQGRAASFFENDWSGRTLQIGSLTLRILMPTMRCVMTTLEQSELRSDPEILKSLVKANMVDIPSSGRYPCIGVYAGLSRRPGTGGEIALADPCFLS